MLPHIKTSPLLHNKNRKSSKKNINYNNPDKLGDGDSWSKRRKVSARQSWRTRTTRLLAAHPTAALPVPPEPAPRLNPLQQNPNTIYS